jgi:uncharacterized protein
MSGSTIRRWESRAPRQWVARIAACVLCLMLLSSLAPTGAAAQVPANPDKAALPALTAPVNDFAGVIDPASKAEMTRIIEALQQKTGDAVVVATIQQVAPYPDIQDYAVDLFENHGRGIGARDKDSGALVLLSVGDRKVRIESGYGLEGFITDGFAGETSREYMAPLFRQGQYGAGLKAGVVRLVSRIAQERGVTLDNVPASPPVRPRSARPQRLPIPLLVIVAFLILQVVLRNRRPPGGPRHWGGGPWSGWSGGVGPFGGSYGGWSSGGGGFSGGSFGGGGGFGGFGGGRSGGGGGGASW